MFFNIVENEASITPQKYTIICSNKKCKYEMLINHLWFCSYECLSCKSKNVNPLHKQYHRGRRYKKCGYEHEMEIIERNKPAEVKNLKDEKVSGKMALITI